MRTVGIKVLKNQLSKYVRLAASGETVQVTDRNKIVAELVPPRSPADMSDAKVRWAELIRRGIVTPAKNPQAPLPPREPIMRFEKLMKELDEDREDRW